MTPNVRTNHVVPTALAAVGMNRARLYIMIEGRGSCCYVKCAAQVAYLAAVPSRFEFFGRKLRLPDDRFQGPQLDLLVIWHRNRNG